MLRLPPELGGRGTTAGGGKGGSCTDGSGAEDDSAGVAFADALGFAGGLAGIGSCGESRVGAAGA
jgi:hypothetical protein